jgi:hypothetical protein
MPARARRSVVVLAATLVVVSPLLMRPASAGGSWIAPERSAYVLGDIAVVGGSFGSGSHEGRIDDGPFIAYLLPATRWITNRKVPEIAIPLGELRITGSGGFFRARVEFRVPDVPGGLYHVQYCNDPCTVDGIGDLIGSDSFAIGATRTEARLLIQVQRLRWKIDEAAYRARAEASDEIRRVKLELRTARGQLAIAEDRVRLAGVLESTRRALREERSTVAAAMVFAGGLLVAVVALLVMLIVTARRLRTARVDAELQAIAGERAPVGERM